MYERQFNNGKVNANYLSQGVVRLEAGKTKTALASLENVFTHISPDGSFTYQFSDAE